MSGRTTINGDNTLFRTPRGNGGGGGGQVFTDFTIYGNNTALDPLGVNYNVNKTLFVDVNFGNDATAEKYQPLKPYQRIGTALANASAGELVYVMAGEYREQIFLKDQVDLYFNVGCKLYNQNSFSRIFRITGTNQITCNILGYAELDSGVTYTNFQFYNCMEFRGSLLNIYFECQSATSNRGMCNIVTTDLNSNVEIFIRNGYKQDKNASFYSEARALSLNWQQPFLAGGNVTFRWGGTTYCSEALATENGLTQYNVNLIGNVELLQNSRLAYPTSSTSKFYFQGNVISNEQTSVSPYLASSFVGIITQTQGEITILAPKIQSKYQPIFKPVFADGRTYYKGQEAITEFVVPIVNTMGANGAGKFIIEGVRFIDYNQSRSEMVYWGNSNGAFTTENVYMFNCYLIKDPNYLGTGGLLSKNFQGGDSRFFGIGCIFICAPNQTLTETDNVAYGEFYFDACSTNKDLGVNTTNVGGSLQTNKTYLEVNNPI